MTHTFATAPTTTVTTADRDRWLAVERRRGYIRARLWLIPPSEGGRRTAIFSGYRASWTLDPAQPAIQRDAPLLIESGDVIDAGTAAVVRLHPLVPDRWRGVAPGQRLHMHEGLRHVGTAEIIEVVSLTVTTVAESRPAPRARPVTRALVN